MISSTDPEVRAEFLLRLRTRGLRDLSTLRALEAVPRDIFAPLRYAHLAMRDIALPIACGQTMSEPFLIGKMVEALSLDPAHRVLEIGTGSGYGTAVLAWIAGEVVSAERRRGLVDAAAESLRRFGAGNAAVVWADGLDLPADLGRFDRALVDARMDRLPDTLEAHIADDAVLVCGRGATSGPSGEVVQVVRSKGVWGRPTVVCAARPRPLESGLSRA